MSIKIDSFFADGYLFTSKMSYIITETDGYYIESVVSLDVNGTETKIKSIREGAGKRTIARQFSFDEGDLFDIYALLKTTIRGYVVLSVNRYRDSSYTNKVDEAASKVRIIMQMPAEDSQITIKGLSVSAVQPSTMSSFTSFVQGYSQVSVSFNAYCTSGAQVTSASLVANGRTYPGSVSSGESVSFLVTDPVSQPGENVYRASVVDSRGTYLEFPVTFEVQAYAAPRVAPYSGETEVICYRCNEDGTRNDSGNYVRIKAAKAYATISGQNKCTLSCIVKEKGATTETSTTLLGADGGDKYDGVMNNSGKLFNAKKNYSVELYVMDSVSQKRYGVVYDIASESVFSHEGPNAISFGGYLESGDENVLKNNWDTKLLGKVYMAGGEVVDYCVGCGNSGTNGKWQYQKYNSGLCVVFGTFDVTTSAASELQTYGYVTSVELPILTPFQLLTYTASASLGGTGAWLSGVEERAPKQYKVHITSFNYIPVGTQYKVHIIIYGTWK